MTNDDKDLKPMTIEEVYKKYNIDNSKKKSIYLWEFQVITQEFVSDMWEAIKHHATRPTPQQPSEPLKGLDKECLCYGAWGESHPDCPIHSLEAKFGQPSEKKALSVKDIESIIETTAFNQGESFIDKKPYAQAIHSALPAQREVRYPEKVKVPHDGKFGGVSFERIKAIERNDTIDEFKKLNGGGVRCVIYTKKDGNT